MKREVVETRDGSDSIYVHELDEHYHSSHGAINESRHVFIRHGLDFQSGISGQNEELNIFEVGFGTGLNLMLAIEFALENKTEMRYWGVEAFPIEPELFGQLNYCGSVKVDGCEELFRRIHKMDWETEAELLDRIKAKKIKGYLEEIMLPEEYFDVIFFDAFSPRSNPELWTVEVFEKLFRAMKPDASLVTYCVQGNARRAMKAAGLVVEKLPGPPGKREMARARKLVNNV